MKRFLKQLQRKIITILFFAREQKKPSDHSRFGHAYYKRMLKPKRVLNFLLSLKRKWFDRPIKLGREINGYTVLKLISVGTYGAIYLVKNNMTEERVVLKHIRKSKNKDQKVFYFFQNEMKILSKCSNPNIPRFIERFDVDDQPYYCMEYLEGKTLETLIFHHRNTFTLDESLHILRKLVEIVSYLHSNNIIHRDIRLPNVLIVDGNPYLIDFGYAREIDNPSLDVYETNDHYNEALRFSRLVSFESDFYLLGQLFLYMLYSSFQPEKEEKSWEEELQLDPQVCGMLRRMLQIDSPFTNISELANDLENIVFQSVNNISVS